MAIPAMALLQQHDTCQDILIEPAARLRAPMEAWGHSELGAQSGSKNKWLVTYFSRFIVYTSIDLTASENTS